MVTKATNLGRNGVSDWIMQRASAVILAAYTVFVVGYLLLNDVDAAMWQGLFSSLPMQIFSMLAVLAFVAHAWIGMWTVVTDYVKPIRVRYAAIMAIALILFAYLVWGVAVVFGN
ncbi:succinate dehydrogenase, hydrophobic membrane anchor protein [Litorivicinus lipolyticus]|jgi:succinate dehydrogenase / fumarate reductase, membrane anchor subunit|uniref:Succinate dehydrogenase hydrophobic membrane anchor subunit n=1 Tax=Litorivicinus lipolyticus TaxID=418701 RepID=A0A5Q2QDZ2_9GAMM|nr:succinate dehydrogenase, hydrophobic membrane anchor protein [Litorivicinus lipolyticus]QGG80542.1 succinate dehydrogenase, hydrophobic membrane anchor protein [Litorivicinus lipolyticus]